MPRLLERGWREATEVVVGPGRGERGFVCARVEGAAGNPAAPRAVWHSREKKRALSSSVRVDEFAGQVLGRCPGKVGGYGAVVLQC